MASNPREFIKNCFPQLLASPEGRARMKEMIPVYDEDIKLPAEAGRYQEVSRRANEVLGLR